MAKSASKTVSELKTELINMILEDDIVVKALHSSKPDFIQQDLPTERTSLIDENIFRYKHVPGIQEEANTFVTMAIRAEWDERNRRTLRNMSIYIYVFTHQTLQKTKYGSIRTDIVGDIIDEKLSGLLCFGLNRLSLKSRYEYNMAESEYNGCVLEFSTVNLVARKNK